MAIRIPLGFKLFVVGGIDRTLACLPSHFCPQTVIVKLSQPFVCQLFLLGCILLNLTTAFYLGVPTDAACLGRPWMLHVALTFTSRYTSNTS